MENHVFQSTSLAASTFLSFVIACLTIGSVGVSEEFRLLSWNVESNRPNQSPVSDPSTISEQLTQLLSAPATRSQIITLSEVDPKTFSLYATAIAKGLQSEWIS